ncbi:cation:proton antiporter regulatory subunit [Pontibacterium granulatum]|uniref:cation:proton antiporter regulatory subunit n=1 Tax=Pontibacterium granulatum TaxID=2036029 RepID=UPI003CE44925
MAEIYVPAESHFIGKTISESGLPEQDINVLTLYRGDTVIPNPKVSRALESGDKLLCFGKLDAMKKLVPLSARRKRKPRIKPLDD